MFLKPTRKYKYLVRPDGTIRVTTKGRVLRQEGDVLVESSTFFSPGEYVYDFDAAQMVRDTEAKKGKRRAKAPPQDMGPAVALAKKHEQLRASVSELPPKTEEAFLLLGDLLGIDLH